MSCSDIYDELQQYANGARGEPYIQNLCARAIQELQQVLDSVQQEHQKVEALIAENCELRAEIDELKRRHANAENWFQGRGYA